MSNKPIINVIYQDAQQTQPMGCLELAVSAIVIGLFVVGFLLS